MSSSAGRVLLMPKGAYAAGTTYQVMDAVTYNGNSYVCKQTSTGNLPTNTTYWQILVDNSAVATEVSNVKQALNNEIVTRATLGAHNLFNIFESEINVSGTLTAIVGSDGSITANGTPSSAFVLPNISNGKYNGKVYNLKPNTKYVISYGIAQTNSLKLQAFSKATSDGSWSKFAETTTKNELEFTTPASFYDLWVRILIDSNTAVSSLTFYPMICDAKDAYKGYQPYAMTNKELTDNKAEKNVLNNEAETRAKLGAHNLLKLSLEEIKALNYAATWNGNVCTYNNVTMTVNLDDNGKISDITLNTIGTITGTVYFSLSQTNDFGDNQSANAYNADTFNGYIISDGYKQLNAYLFYNINKLVGIRIASGASLSNVKMYPMVRLATDSDPTYQPHVMTNSELTSLLDGFITVKQYSGVTLEANEYVSPFTHFAQLAIGSDITAYGTPIAVLDVPPQVNYNIDYASGRRITFAGGSAATVTCKVVFAKRVSSV